MDEDGHAYLDLVNNFCFQVHGQAHPDIVAAVQCQAAQGFSFGLPTHPAQVVAAGLDSMPELA